MNRDGDPSQNGDMKQEAIWAGLAARIAALLTPQPLSGQTAKPDVMGAELDEISQALQTLFDHCPRKAYDDLGKIHHSAQARVTDLREEASLRSQPVDVEQLKREVFSKEFVQDGTFNNDDYHFERGFNKAIDHLHQRGLIGGKG